MSAAARPRLIGVAVPDVSDWRDPEPVGKWSQFFAALGQQFDLVDVVRPELSRAQELLGLARAAHPDKGTWLARAGFNQRVLGARSEAVQLELDRRAGRFDVIVQLQTLCRPGTGHSRRPHVIYTDSTFALLRRCYPAGARISKTAVADWLRFEADVCRSAAAVFTFSEFTRGSMIEDYGCAPDTVHAVGAGANVILSPQEAAKVRTGRPQALFVGAEFERKGGAVLLEAWRDVHRRVPEAELVIAGPRQRPSLSDDAGVRWIGRVGRAELLELYASASLFVLPSLFEPWGFVFYEAMGSGLPCVATDCCAMPEMVQDGVTGRVVPPGSPEPLADALAELLADPARAAEMGRSGYERVCRSHRWSDVIARLASRLPAPETPLGQRTAV